jgi:hypothetical protein
MTRMGHGHHAIGPWGLGSDLGPTRFWTPPQSIGSFALLQRCATLHFMAPKTATLRNVALYGAINRNVAQRCIRPLSEIPPAYLDV